MFFISLILLPRKLILCSRTASENFQRTMANILSGLPGVFHFIDDIVVHDGTMQEHENMRKVLSRLQDERIRLNREKCEFRRRSIEFLGLVLSSEGVAPSPEKLKSIQEMARPDSRENLRSLLGLASFVGIQFIPHFSTLAKPLRDMLSPRTLCGLQSRKLHLNVYVLRFSIANSLHSLIKRKR